MRAIYHAKTPIISAVGHEVDFTLADFVADMRAPTPSAAAELVVQEQEALAEKVRLLGARMDKSLARQLELAKSRLALATSSYVFRRPEELVRQRRQQVDELRMRIEDHVEDQIRLLRRRLDHAARSLLLLSPGQRVHAARLELAAKLQRLLGAANVSVARARARFQPVIAQLDALSPLAVLSRGYALAWKLPGRKLVRDVNQLAPKDTLEIRFGHGGANVTVDRILEEPSNG